MVSFLSPPIYYSVQNTILLYKLRHHSSTGRTADLYPACLKVRVLLVAPLQYACWFAAVVELADTKDLKSFG